MIYSQKTYYHYAAKNIINVLIPVNTINVNNKDLRLWNLTNKCQTRTHFKENL